MTSKFATPARKKLAKRKTYRFPSHWSYSTWKVYSTCKHRYELQYLQKLKQPGSIHLERGIFVHKLAEDFLDDVSQARVPKELKEFKDELKAIRKAGAEAEKSIAFTKSWQETEPTDWSNAWLRVKLDATLIDGDEATVIDFKTGRAYPDTAEQSELYALAVFQLFPDVKAIDAEFWYVDSGDVVPYFFGRENFPKIKKKWQARAQEMLANRQFSPTKDSYACRYCPFRSDVKLANGLNGPCEAWKKAK